MFVAILIAKILIIGYAIFLQSVQSLVVIETILFHILIEIMIALLEYLNLRKSKLEEVKEKAWIKFKLEARKIMLSQLGQFSILYFLSELGLQVGQYLGRPLTGGIAGFFISFKVN